MEKSSDNQLKKNQIDPLTPVNFWRKISIGLLILTIIFIIASSIGPVYLPIMNVLEIIFSRAPFIVLDQHSPSTWNTIIWDIRLPRIALSALVGASLSLSGAAYQGLFRNPLADPYLIGVSSGAGLGATVILVTGLTNPNLLPFAAFTGALISVSVAYAIAHRSDALPLQTLILSGVAISSLASAITALLMIQSDPEIRPILNWLLGGFSKAQWVHTFLVLLYFIPCATLILIHSRVLNVMQLEEEHARQVGINVDRTKIILIISASLTTAAAVSFSGLIGFVGLIAPHVARLIWGMDYRQLIPLSMLLGSGLLVIADLIARTVVTPAELPVGIVTAFCGAPFFLYLLTRKKINM